MTNAKKLFRSGLLALTLLTVSTPVAFAAADTTTTEAAPQQNQGFDDWGLLGLLGLAGLLGLRRNDTTDGTRR